MKSLSSLVKPRHMRKMLEQYHKAIEAAFIELVNGAELSGSAVEPYDLFRTCWMADLARNPNNADLLDARCRDLWVALPDAKKAYWKSAARAYRRHGGEW